MAADGFAGTAAAEKQPRNAEKALLGQYKERAVQLEKGIAAAAGDIDDLEGTVDRLD